MLVQWNKIWGFQTLGKTVTVIPLLHNEVPGRLWPQKAHRVKSSKHCASTDTKLQSVGVSHIGLYPSPKQTPPSPKKTPTELWAGQEHMNKFLLHTCAHRFRQPHSHTETALLKRTKNTFDDHIALKRNLQSF